MARPLRNAPELGHVLQGEINRRAVPAQSSGCNPDQFIVSMIALDQAQKNIGVG